MKKSYNTKKPLSMLPLLALASFNTSMYSMEVVQPEAPQIVVFLTHVENNTNKDLTITIDGKNYVIKAGETRNLSQQVNVDMNPVKDKFTMWGKYIPIKHEGEIIVQVLIDGKSYPVKPGFFNFLITGKEFQIPIDQYHFPKIKPDKSYDFSIQLTLEGENLEKSEIEVAAVEK